MLLATFQYHKTFGTEKNIFNGFYHNNYKGVAAILDSHVSYKLSFLLQKKARHRIWLEFIKRLQRKIPFKMVDDRRRRNCSNIRSLLGYLSRVMRKPTSGFRAGPTQARQYSYSRWLKA